MAFWSRRNLHHPHYPDRRSRLMRLSSGRLQRQFSPSLQDADAFSYLIFVPRLQLAKEQNKMSLLRSPEFCYGALIS
ncbi:hypothetical protein DAI22_09g052200 [Oryza sativa Japonica Group]|nr:hypothetical protein DAI22_09g052200 [Oryza sativa Japonica Group]